MRNNHYGFALKARNGQLGTINYFFTCREEAVEVKALIDHGRTLEQALADQRARIDREVG